MFSSDELRRLVRYMPNGGDDLVAHLPGRTSSPAALANALVEELVRRGLLDSDFMDLLERERPGRKADIRALRELLGL